MPTSIGLDLLAKTRRWRTNRRVFWTPAGPFARDNASRILRATLSYLFRIVIKITSDATAQQADSIFSPARITMRFDHASRYFLRHDLPLVLRRQASARPRACKPPAAQDGDTLARVSAQSRHAAGGHAPRALYRRKIRQLGTGAANL